MRGSDHCPDALFARSRHGRLSLVEQRALSAHLGVCGLCRGEMLLASLCDDIPDTDSESHGVAAARVVRLATRVAHGKAYGRGRSRRVSRPLAVAFAAVVLAMGGAAAAWMIARRGDGARPEEGPRVSHPLAPSGTLAQANSAPPAEDSPAALAASPAAAPPRPAARREGPAATPARPPFARDRDVRSGAGGRTEGPAELFAAANAARRARAFADAVARYHALQRRFPASDEAQLSFFSAGDVLLRLHAPARALAEFDRYLDARPAGSLAAEALFGRARCLDALGRPSEGIEAWRQLLRDFPHSLYESAARRRLAEIDR